MTDGNKTTLVLVSGVMLCAAVPADACGWSMSSGELGVLLAIIGAVLAVPIALAAAGLIAAFRMRRAGRLGSGKVALTGVAVVMELALAQACGWGSLVGLACLGAVALQAMLLFGTAAFGRPPEPLRGVLTVMADPRVFAGVPS